MFNFTFYQWQFDLSDFNAIYLRAKLIYPLCLSQTKVATNLRVGTVVNRILNVKVTLFYDVTLRTFRSQ